MENVSLLLPKLFLKGTTLCEQENKFQPKVENYCSTCYDYLLKWISSIDKFNSFTWMLLNTLLAWKQVESSGAVLKKKRINTDDNAPFCLCTF